MKKLLTLSISAILLVSAFSACQSKLPEDDSLVIENNYLAAECAESKMTSDGAGLYFCYSPYNLHYIDTDTQNAAVLCSKPDCPHYVENPGIESLDCFAQMIYDQGGNLYYYQEKFITLFSAAYKQMPYWHRPILLEQKPKLSSKYRTH